MYLLETYKHSVLVSSSETIKHVCLCLSHRRISVSSIQGITLAKKTSVTMKQGLCFNQTGHLYNVLF